MKYICYYQSGLWKIVMLSDGKSLTGLWLDTNISPDKAKLSEYTEKSLPVFEQTKEWLDCYFSGNQPEFTPSLLPNGSLFRMSVWDILLKIPYGETITYGEIGKEIAKKNNLSKMSAQAVGGAVGHNPISIIVPCHRVVGSKGNLTGYAWGIDKKIELLKLEKVNMDKLFLPKK